MIYLLAFGFGFGALVAEVAGLSHREFIATGTIAVVTLGVALAFGVRMLEDALVD